MEKQKTKRVALICAGALLLVGLCVSIAFNIYQAFFGWDSYLQSTEEIEIMEAGILCNNQQFHDGGDRAFIYDFSHENYGRLKSEYKLEDRAKEGTEFQRALRLMDEYAPRLTHKSDYDNHVPMNALDLLEYSLDNKKQGIIAGQRRRSSTKCACRSAFTPARSGSIPIPSTTAIATW